MRAVISERYGPPEILRVGETQPPALEDDHVLVRVHATTVTRTDCHRRAANPFMWRLLSGLLRPRYKVLGSEVAGEVETVGALVTRFTAGDRVFGVTPGNVGAHAELVCIPETGAIATMPDGTTFEEAAPVCDGGILALASLRHARVGPGQRVLVYGASGSIGSAAVQLANHFGAEVTAVCNTGNLQLVSSLGADKVIDYLEEDFTANGEKYDVIHDAAGKLSFARCERSLTAGGRYLATDGLGNLLRGALGGRSSSQSRKRVIFPVPPRFTQEDVEFLGELVRQGKYRAVIDRSYPLEEVVDAARYVETGQKTGNVVLTLVPDSAPSVR
jgi:NADPH:quinone reductase-like Zn-dependent oxidoreductase